MAESLSLKDRARRAMWPNRQVVYGILLALWISCLGGTTTYPVAAQGPSDTQTPPAGYQPRKPDYVGGPSRLVAGPVIRVYQDTIPWFGENRDRATLLALGKTMGVDYFVHSLADLSTGPIPANTRVVLITSNGEFGSYISAAQTTAAAQANLAAFVQSGGILIVDMGDNDSSGGYQAPGAVGTPAYIFPTPCGDATLTSTAIGSDGILGTGDDHPIVKGPDGLPGTSDDLTNSNIDMLSTCHIAHGNLADGLTLPAQATVLMTADFGGPKPILASYRQGQGCVILDTLTKEFTGQTPAGAGASIFMSSLFQYALNGAPGCRTGLPVKPAVFRQGTWLLRNSLSAGPADLAFLYGAASDIPLMCDWDGNGSRTPGVFRDGTWYLKNSNSGGFGDISLTFGQAGDFPICGDWNGDGVESVGVVRGAGWYLRNTLLTGPADVTFTYGVAGDRFVVGDWDGNGTATPGVLRNGQWYLRNANSTGMADVVYAYGFPPGDMPIVGDWNADGVDTVGVVRGNLWLLRNSHSAGMADLSFQYGAPGDIPLVWR